MAVIGHKAVHWYPAIIGHKAVHFKLQNDVQFVKIKEKLFCIHFNQVINEYSCLHMVIVFPHSRL